MLKTMLESVFLPWWAWAYLCCVLAVFVLSWISDLPRTRDLFASVLSFLTLCTCVIGYFNAPVVAFFGWFMIPMVALGVYWEFRESVLESEMAQDMLDEDPELTQEERDVLLNVAIAFNALIVVPGYVMGLILCFDVLGLV